MLFSEIYSAYFTAIAKILRTAQQGTITEKQMTEIANKTAFSESFLSIVPALRQQEWLLMNSAGQTPIRKPPHMPLTILHKRWLKTLLSDPRIALFAPDITGLEDLQPLFEPCDIVYFDRYEDGDHFTDAHYITVFRTILKALRENRRLKIRYESPKGRRISGTYNPWKLEYSGKDDKFRLLTNGGNFGATINLGRITSCKLLSANQPATLRSVYRETTVSLILTDERNALERVLLAFSDCRKETRRMDDTHYEIRLWYSPKEETEMLIRILSFGQMLRVTAPDRFVALLQERISRQLQLLS